MKKSLSLFLSLALSAALAAPAAGISAGRVDVNSGNLNIRSAGSTSAPILSRLPNRSYVTLHSSGGGWWCVEYAPGKYGYCHENYISALSGTPASVNIQQGSLNVRSGAGTGYAKTDSLTKGEQVVILSSSGSWSHILYDGVKTGYVSSSYLTGTGSTYTKISLSVPSFKQTDSRWASVILGSSGKNMAKIGCTTTGIAMMESFRTGSTIYPHNMAKRLSYTASGNVYWPSHYSVVTSSANYLSGIYQKLKSGKPVLLGAKTYSGNQHWVVVTGFKGGTLTSGNFTVNDPGSSVRTTLDAFLLEYPIFYKYFSY